MIPLPPIVVVRPPTAADRLLLESLGTPEGTESFVGRIARLKCPGANPPVPDVPDENPNPSPIDDQLPPVPGDGVVPTPDNLGGQGDAPPVQGGTPTPPSPAPLPMPGGGGSGSSGGSDSEGDAPVPGGEQRQ